MPVVVTIRCNRVPLSICLSRAVYVECEAFQLIAGIKRDGADEAVLCVLPFPHPFVLLYGPTPPPHAATDVAFLPPRCSSSWDL